MCADALRLAGDHADSLDRAAQHALSQQFPSLVDSLITQLRSATRRPSWSVLGLLSMYDEHKPRLAERLHTLIETQLVQAIRQAPVTMDAILQDAYGAVRAKQLRERQQQRPAFLRAAEMSESALTDQAVRRIAALPDEFGYTYSQRIWRMLEDVRNLLQQTMAKHVRDFTELRTALDDFVELQLDDPSLPRHIKRVKQAARQALTRTKASKEALLREVKQAQRYVDKLTPGERGTQGFQRRTMQRLKNAALKGNEAAIDEALKFFVEKRMRYRAQVLVRTETYRAYRAGVLDEYQRQDVCLAVRWQLSPSHKVRDKCDLYAQADMGLGKGVWPKQSVPQEHVSGRCRLTPVLADWEDIDDPKPWKPADSGEFQRIYQDVTGPRAREINRLGRQGKPIDTLVRGVRKARMVQ